MDTTILVGEKPWESREILRPLARHVGKIHLPMRPQEAPRRRVVRAGHLLCGVKGAEDETFLVKPNLGGEGAGAALADSAKIRSAQAADRHGGAEAARLVRGGEMSGRRTECEGNAFLITRAGRGAPKPAR